MGRQHPITAPHGVLKWMARTAAAYLAENPDALPTVPTRRILSLGKGTKLGELVGVDPDLDGFLAQQAEGIARDGLTRTVWEGLTLLSVVHLDPAGRPAIHRFDRQ